MNEQTSLQSAVQVMLAPKTPPRAARPRFRTKTASEIEPCPVEFLWNPYLPIGETTVVMAAGGTGKTYFLCGLAAELSRGRLPLNPFDGDEPVHTLFISAEDRGSIFRERLEAANADLGCIHILDDSDSIGLTLTDDGAADFAAAIRESRAKLVIVDPLHAFVGDIDLNRVNAVRPVMHRLAGIAKATGSAIVIVSHVSKRQTDGNANNLAIGSVDIVNAARSVLRVTGDETGLNPQRRVLVQTKSNYAGYGASIAFALGDDGIEWLGYSALTRELLEQASVTHKPLADVLAAQGAGEVQTRRDLAEEAIIGLAAKQTVPRAFYSYQSLRESFPDAFGAGQIKRTLDALRAALYQKGVKVEDGRKRSADENSRGVWLEVFQNFDA